MRRGGDTARTARPRPRRRAVGRILARRGALDGRRRTRRPAPPPGWHLPGGADGEIDSFDIVEGLRIKDGPQVEVLTAVSLHGGLADAWPVGGVVTTDLVLELIERRWREHGLPAFAQFDNDTIFQGPHNRPGVVGRVTRLCLSLGVVPVFAPPREPGFQAAVESFNGRWQQKAWARFRHGSLDELLDRSARYVAAARLRLAERIARAPARRPFPEGLRFDPAAPPRGAIVFIRRTDERGAARVLEQAFAVDPLWPSRLVRATVLLDERRIDFHALRRREPGHQPLLATAPCDIAAPQPDK